METQTSGFERNYFNWEGWDQTDAMVFNFYEIEFVRDFGVFKKGDTFDCVSLSYDNGVLEAYSEDGVTIVKSQKFELNPI